MIVELKNNSYHKLLEKVNSVLEENKTRNVHAKIDLTLRKKIDNELSINQLKKLNITIQEIFDNNASINLEILQAENNQKENYSVTMILSKYFD